MSQNSPTISPYSFETLSPSMGPDMMPFLVRLSTNSTIVEPSDGPISASAAALRYLLAIQRFALIISESGGTLLQLRQGRQASHAKLRFSEGTEIGTINALDCYLLDMEIKRGNNPLEEGQKCEVNDASPFEPQ
jgi:hypothetical protein